MNPCPVCSQDRLQAVTDALPKHYHYGFFSGHVHQATIAGRVGTLCIKKECGCPAETGEMSRPVSIEELAPRLVYIDEGRGKCPKCRAVIMGHNAIFTDGTVAWVNWGAYA